MTSPKKIVIDDTPLGLLAAFNEDLSKFGGGPSNPTETILFYFTANGQQSYACQYDGRIRQAGAASNGNIGISVNTDLPSSAISVQSVYQGQNVILWPTAVVSNQLFYVNHAVKTGDLVKVRNYNASTNAVSIVLERDHVV